MWRASYYRGQGRAARSNPARSRSTPSWTPRERWLVLSEEALTGSLIAWSVRADSDDVRQAALILQETRERPRAPGRWCMNKNGAAAPHSYDLPQAPIAKDSDLPRAVIRFRMLQAISASAACDFG